MSALGMAGIGCGVAALAVPIRTVIKLHAPVRPTLKYVLPATLGTLLLTPVVVKALPVVGLLVACLPGYFAYRGAHRHASMTYPRRVTAALLESRLRPIIGDPWTGRAMRVDYKPSESADPDDIARVIIKTPRAVLPSKITDRCKEVLNETLSGAKQKKWKASTVDTVITFTPKAEIQDPRALKHLKSVLQDNRALGAKARVEVNEWDDAGEIAAFTGKARKELANLVASRIRQVHIEGLVHTRVPITNGSWVVTWDVTGVPTMTVRRSAFRDIIYKEPPERFIQSRAEAAAEYPNAVFKVGLHPDGRVCTRTPIKEPNGLTTGATGKGKTTYLHNELIDASAWGFIIVIVDGKFADSYVGFRDWPGVQIVANDMYTAIRTIFYIAEMLSRRQDGGRSGEFPVDNNTAVLFIVDEYADLVTRIQTEVWDIFKGKDKDLPNLCPAITVLERLPQMIRQFRIHMETGTQKPDSKRISQNIIFNSDKKSQWGEMTGAQSQAYWGDYNTGPSVPPIAGRGVIKTIDGKPEPVQGFYVPDPLKATTREQFELLAKMMPPKNLHRRIVFEIPDPDTASWEDIVTAPWRFAEDRPDLDPLSPEYNPPAFIKYNTFGELNPATLDVDDSNGHTGGDDGCGVTDLDGWRKT
jgi:hypothetical protein